MKARIVGLIGAVLLAAGARAVFADPIVVITGGFMGEANGLDFPGFTITGDGSTIMGAELTPGFICCTFNGGDTVALTRGYGVASSAPITTFPTIEVVNGTRYTGVFLSGGMRFTATPFVAPMAPASTTLQPFSFSTPFQMTGHLSGFSTPSMDGVPLFSVDLAGSGTATVRGNTLPTSLRPPDYVGQSLGFSFSAEAPSPTPEPASLLLLGSGVAAIALQRRRRGRPSQSSK